MSAARPGDRSEDRRTDNARCPTDRADHVRIGAESVAFDPPQGAGLSSEQARVAASAITPCPEPLRPVFLHGLWRSGSTYVWSRFRVTPCTLCFYEPLHDGLRRLTAERIRRDTPDSIKDNHHPELAQPYFAEFAPLLARRGVRGYQRRFAYSRFAPRRDEPDAALEAYVQSLIDRAREHDRSAVLGFNRTGLRVAWLRDRFDACNIHIDRDPIDIFSSYLGQLQSGNYYYFTKWMQIIAGNRDYPLFKEALSKIPRPNLIEKLLVRPKTFYRNIIDDVSLDTLYSITFLAWVVCCLHALEHCDLIIDIARADQAGYSQAIAAALRRHSGLSVSFDDMHAPSPPSPLRLVRQRTIERDVLDWIRTSAPDGLLDRSRIRRRLDELSPRRAELLAQVV